MPDTQTPYGRLAIIDAFFIKKKASFGVDFVYVVMDHETCSGVDQRKPFFKGRY
jgi:hypothetical protein